MPRNESPELIDWNESRAPRDNRLYGAFPAFALGALVGGSLYGHNFCRPRSYHGWRDYYTCSPKYICKPVPYWPGQ